MDKGSLYGNLTNARRLHSVKPEDSGSVYGSHTNARRLSTAQSDGGGKGSVYGSLINAQRLISINPAGFSSNASLHSRIGGDAMVGPLVRYFYGKALRDRRIRRLFDYADGREMEKQIQKQIAFLGAALGGPKVEGIDVDAGYRKLSEIGLSDEHFDAVSEHLVGTLREQNVPGQLIEEMKAFCESARKEVLG